MGNQSSRRKRGGSKWRYKDNDNGKNLNYIFDYYLFGLTDLAHWYCTTEGV